MSEPPFQPSTVTKPIQLLAAWLIGLVAIDASFLGASAVIHNPDWAAGALVIAAILNVPIFLAALFLLQTKFRPEMQEDGYYAQYLERSSLTRKIEEVATPVVNAFHLNQAGWHGAFRVRKQVRKLPASGTSIDLNDLLPGYPRIKQEIMKLGLSISSEFGSTSDGKLGVPKNGVLAFGPDCSIPVLQSVIRVAAQNGVTGIARVDDGHEDRGRIFVGAYSFDEPTGRSYQRLDEKLLNALLAPSLTEQELEDLVNLSPETDEP